VGAWFGAGGKTIRVHVSATSTWKGVLRFDRPRHREFWRMPENYPRLNAWPEWYAVSADRDYEVVNLETGKKQRLKGAELARGYPVTLDGKNPLRMEVTAVPEG
jgi:hypothetical protein